MLSPYAASHASPNGPGDARPTALQIVRDNGLEGAISDKVMLITGCSSGIGIETARALHETGARLFLTVRDMEKGEAVVKDIVANSSGKGAIELVKIELDSLDSVRAGAAEFLRKSDKLNVFIANAGIMATPHTLTIDGYESQLAVNHLSHFLLLHLLLPTLLSSATPGFSSRAIFVSSLGHRTAGINFSDPHFKTSTYNPWAAYAQSKTANINTANHVERLYGGRGLHGLSLHPGGISTGLQVHVPESVREGWKDNKEMSRSIKSAEQGAATTVWAAVGRELEGKGALYLEDCSVSEPAPEACTFLDRGYKPWAFDEEAERRLWAVSCRMVGVPDAE